MRLARIYKLRLRGESPLLRKGKFTMMLVNRFPLAMTLLVARFV